MIIKNVCLFLEALSIVICLHHLYGEKFRLDIATISFFAVDMIMMQAIDYLELSSTISILMYSIIAVYCGYKFGFKIKEIAVNIVLCIIFVGSVQLIIVFLFSHIWKITHFNQIRLLVMYCIISIIIMFLLPILNIRKISCFISSKGNTLVITVSICIMLVLVWMIFYKKFRFLELEQAILLFTCISLIFILSVQLNKYKIKSTEVETELRMQKVYAESFQGLIDDIHIRQHEFDNHINTIYSQHYKYHTYDELVDVQRKYCKFVTDENRFNKILANGNSIIVGFLYGSLNEINKKGIDISYHVNIQELEIGVPSYKIIEILSDLLNNAVEALLCVESKSKLHIVVEQTDCFYVEVRNESPYIDYYELGLFFDKNYSKKGEGRGLGLYNVKKICEDYNIEILCQNIEIDEINWLSFELWKGKGNSKKSI